MRNFNPRAPCGARLYSFDITADHVVGFQPTRPLRGATFIDRSRNNTQIISTHAPLAGRDERLPFSPLALTQISTHAPLAGRDGRITIALIHDLAFQPTRPLRGATVGNKTSPHIHKLFQPTRPLRGATGKPTLKIYDLVISTHAPLAGRDSKSVQITMHIFAITDKFQMLLHRMPPVRAFCSFLMQENHADFGCEPPK